MTEFTSELISLSVASSGLLEESEEETVIGEIVVGDFQWSDIQSWFASAKVFMPGHASAHPFVTR